ncbi:MAG: penicillin-binding protein 2 [Microgenomates group bacterium]
MREITKSANTPIARSRIFIWILYFCFVAVIIRLFYWQIIKTDTLQAAADAQYTRTIKSQGQRGDILTADGQVLVTNKEVYRLFAQPHLISSTPQEIAVKLAPILVEKDRGNSIIATDSASLAELILTKQEMLEEKLSKEDTKWVSLDQGIPEEIKDTISEMKIFALGFDPYFERQYPEASMAAHITGFVGKDDEGYDLGYFGIEGALEQELKARNSQETFITDALGTPLTPGGRAEYPQVGRTVTTTIKREIQYLVESELSAAMEKYGAKSGEVVVLDPKTGDILGLAAYPTFSQDAFWEADSATYKNPLLTHTYEPGSTFKVLTVAAGIDSGVVERTIICTHCAGPWQYGKYTIRTWNDVYNPGIDLEQGLAKSDNTAMIFIAEQLGADRLKKYITDFGIGEKIHIDLQEDTQTPFPNSWGPVELATISFGQGVTTTSMQMVRAIAAVANEGTMMRPRIIKSVRDQNTSEVITTEPIVERQVISPETADTVTQMMITAAQSGEAQWTQSKSHTIAGKTGTSQIAEAGGYATDRTIASFIGFAPADEPKFVMIVKLVEPESSPWAAETAAPLWYKIADKLFLHLSILPDRL